MMPWWMFSGEIRLTEKEMLEAVRKDAEELKLMSEPYVTASLLRIVGRVYKRAAEKAK